MHSCCSFCVRKVSVFDVRLTLWIGIRVALLVYLVYAISKCQHLVVCIWEEKGDRKLFGVNSTWVHYLSSTLSATWKDCSRKHQQLAEPIQSVVLLQYEDEQKHFWNADRWSGVFSHYIYSLYFPVMSSCIPLLFLTTEQKQWMVSICLHRQNIISKVFKL